MARLATLDLRTTIDEAEYRSRLESAQGRMRVLATELRLQRRPAIVALEGWDAAGKGGTIRRLVEKVDPRAYVAHAIGAPSGDDRGHHWLWRFWRRLPEAGRLAIFDRTWYGRVLVERVEGFCDETAWHRGYREINEFEQQLVRYGSVLVKCFLHIDLEEQERRFRERAGDPLTSWKLTEEDWRNRAKWDAYLAAYEDCFEKTSTPRAPWTLVEANCKRHARVKVLETVVSALEKAL